MRALVVIAVALVAACSPPSELPPMSDSLAAADLEADLASLVPLLLSDYNVPGASVAVLVDGEVVLARGYGQRQAGGGSMPVDENTVFQAASLSKPVVAFGVHRLMAERPTALSLDQPLMAHRPPPGPYDEDDPRFGEVTPRHVLSHSTGLPNWRPNDSGPNPEPLKFRRDPGTDFGYSGEGYLYLQRVVERITGETLDRYLRRTVLDPVGMADSSFLWEASFDDRYASPHDKKGRPREKYRPRQASAAGTLHTTAVDYARFLQAVLGDGPDGTGAWLAKESTIDSSLGWALGVGYEAKAQGDVFWQWGDDGGFKALMAGSRERGVAVVVLTNSDRGLNVARPVVERVLGSELQFLDYRMLNY
ncbi:MAG: serine hydrolase domain-containing protein [Pseudomonadota bacterium]